MSLTLRVSPASDVPIFKQISQQIRRALATGRLKSGEQLPTVRHLAEILVINPNTVARAYQDLIREGVLESQSGRGVYVTEQKRNFSDVERVRRLEGSVEQLCHEAMLLDASLTEVGQILEKKWKELK